MFIHLFTFYIHASNEGLKYIILNIATVGETTYRDILLGQCLKNMGVDYRSKISQNFQTICSELHSTRYKIGRIVTKKEEITTEEIQNILYKLGCDISKIYLSKNELDTLFQTFYLDQEDDYA